MLLVFTQEITPRITYVFKHICTRILGVEVGFTAVIEEFIAHNGPKLSYGKQPMGNELFVKSHGLLTQNGLESMDITVRPWGNSHCFFPVGEKSALPFDIFSAAFYLLSRYEEYLPHVKDALGRFPASASLGSKEGFLDQPVVDQWAMEFKAVLLQHYPSLDVPARSMRVHNLVEAQVPFKYKHRGIFRSVIGYFRDLGKFRLRSVLKRSKVLLTLSKDPFNTLEWVIEMARKGGTPLTVFFMVGEAHYFENNFNTQRNLFRMLIKFVSDYREVGQLFSYKSQTDYEMLKQEKKQMEEITHRAVRSSMNALYRVNLPDIYRNLVELEVTTDFTMVYDDVVGFRAGTCTPFLFYDLDYEIKTPLIIHPIAGTSTALADKKGREVFSCMDLLMRSVAAVNGTFSFVVSNRDLMDDGKQNAWRKLFSEKLQGYES